MSREERRESRQRKAKKPKNSPSSAKNCPTQKSASKGPAFALTARTRAYRALKLPRTSPAMRTRTEEAGGAGVVEAIVRQAVEPL